MIFIKLLNKTKNNKKSLNEFLNIKDIPIDEDYIYTLDGKVLLFIEVNPINISLLSEDEMVKKMDFMSIEFANEQNPYSIYVIPRRIDIKEHIEEQIRLINNLDDEICKNIVNKRIELTSQLVTNENLFEKEFYICIWENDSDVACMNISKRATNWINRFTNCGFGAKVLKETDLILLTKSFTIPEFARKESVDYRDNYTIIERDSIVRNKQNI